MKEQNIPKENVIITEIQGFLGVLKIENKSYLVVITEGEAVGKINHSDIF